ncbi:hypothetical protein [Austwickia chelonae]|uniref:hypothetical protein n=1 Tax=Austwickia chelonae TaxID=100225 RepID=UPI000E2305CF|nr:hypothetical protein [Austwickia chelonae]
MWSIFGYWERGVMSIVVTRASLAARGRFGALLAGLLLVLVPQLIVVSGHHGQAALVTCLVAVMATLVLTTIGDATLLRGLLTGVRERSRRRADVPCWTAVTSVPRTPRLPRAPGLH